MAERRRELTLNVRVTDDEDRMVRALAEHQGLSISDVIRQYIRRAFLDAFPPKKSK
ncbi:MAG TPA: ribbon-helix-helix protein, CopG family [Polyangiaceae bacterium]|nr:ribbon-helix-helix protein, CopG family [Polyangiaceae bacterium]